jgi:hypothetical protein
MRDFVTLVITLLGTLLVLAGAVGVVTRTWLRPEPADGATPGSTITTGGRLRRLAQVTPADRLIAWGALLLLLAAVAAGVVGFNLGAATPVVPR